MSIQDPGQRPNGWGVAGDHERRLRALEATEPGGGDMVDVTDGAQTIVDPPTLYAGTGLLLTEPTAGTARIDVAGAGGTYQQRVLNEATLRAYWPLTDASGSAVDASGGGRDLLPLGTPTYGVEGPFAEQDDTAILFTGVDVSGGTTDDQFYKDDGAGPVVGGLNLFNGTTAHTIEILCYPTSVPYTGTLFTFVIPGVDDISLKLMGPGAAATGLVPTYNRRANVLSATVAIPLNTWSHVAATYDGTSQRLYINGALVGTLVAGSILVSSGQAQLARNSGDRYFKGRLAQCALYTSALSQTTLAAHARAGVASAIDVSFIRAVTATYQALASDQVILASGTFTVTLPTAASVAGRQYTVKNTGVGTITVSASGSENIDGAGTPGTVALTVSKDAVTLVSDGAGWQIVEDVAGAGVTDATIPTSDITTNNASSTKHGWLPKTPNDATKFLDGTATYDTVKDSDLSTSDITTNDVTTAKHGFVPKSPGDNAKFLRGGNPPTWEVVGGVTSVVASDTIWDAKGDLAAGTGADAAAVLPAGSNGQVPTYDSTQTTGLTKAFPPGYELGYTAITSSVSVVSTTESSGTTIISPGAITFDGTPVIVEFFAPAIQIPNATSTTNFVVVSLFEGATQIGRICTIILVDLATGQLMRVPGNGRLRFTPTAGSHTYTVKAHANATTGTPDVEAGAGGTGTLVPAFVRFTKA